MIRYATRQNFGDSKTTRQIESIPLLPSQSVEDFVPYETIYGQQDHVDYLPQTVVDVADLVSYPNGDKIIVKDFIYDVPPGEAIEISFNKDHQELATFYTSQVEVPLGATGEQVLQKALLFEQRESADLSAGLFTGVTGYPDASNIVGTAYSGEQWMAARQAIVPSGISQHSGLFRYFGNQWTKVAVNGGIDAYKPGLFNTDVKYLKHQWYALRGFLKSEISTPASPSVITQSIASDTDLTTLTNFINGVGANVSDAMKEIQILHSVDKKANSLKYYKVLASSTITLPTDFYQTMVPFETTTEFTLKAVRAVPLDIAHIKAGGCTTEKLAVTGMVSLTFEAKQGINIYQNCVYERAFVLLLNFDLTSPQLYWPTFASPEYQLTSGFLQSSVQSAAQGGIQGLIFNNFNTGNGRNIVPSRARVVVGSGVNNVLLLEGVFVQRGNTQQIDFPYRHLVLSSPILFQGFDESTTNVSLTTNQALLHHSMILGDAYANITATDESSGYDFNPLRGPLAVHITYDYGTYDTDGLLPDVFVQMLGTSPNFNNYVALGHQSLQPRLDTYHKVTGVYSGNDYTWILRTLAGNVIQEMNILQEEQIENERPRFFSVVAVDLNRSDFRGLYVDPAYTPSAIAGLNRAIAVSTFEYDKSVVYNTGSSIRTSGVDPSVSGFLQETAPWTQITNEFNYSIGPAPSYTVVDGVMTGGRLYVSNDKQGISKASVSYVTRGQASQTVTQQTINFIATGVTFTNIVINKMTNANFILSLDGNTITMSGNLQETESGNNILSGTLALSSTPSTPSYLPSSVQVTLAVSYNNGFEITGLTIVSPTPCFSILPLTGLQISFTITGQSPNGNIGSSSSPIEIQNVSITYGCLVQIPHTSVSSDVRNVYEIVLDKFDVLVAPVNGNGNNSTKIPYYSVLSTARANIEGSELRQCEQNVAVIPGDNQIVTHFGDSIPVVATQYEIGTTKINLGINHACAFCINESGTTYETRYIVGRTRDTANTNDKSPIVFSGVVSSSSSISSWDGKTWNGKTKWVLDTITVSDNKPTGFGTSTTLSAPETIFDIATYTHIQETENPIKKCFYIAVGSPVRIPTTNNCDIYYSMWVSDGTLDTDGYMTWHAIKAETCGNTVRRVKRIKNRQTDFVAVSGDYESFAIWKNPNTAPGSTVNLWDIAYGPYWCALDFSGVTTQTIDKTIYDFAAVSCSQLGTNQRLHYTGAPSNPCETGGVSKYAGLPVFTLLYGDVDGNNIDRTKNTIVVSGYFRYFTTAPNWRFVSLDYIGTSVPTTNAYSAGRHLYCATTFENQVFVGGRATTDINSIQVIAPLRSTVPPPVVGTLLSYRPENCETITTPTGPIQLCTSNDGIFATEYVRRIDTFNGYVFALTVDKTVTPNISTILVNTSPFNSWNMVENYYMVANDMCIQFNTCCSPDDGIPTICRLTNTRITLPAFLCPDDLIHWLIRYRAVPRPPEEIPQSNPCPGCQFAGGPCATGTRSEEEDNIGRLVNKVFRGPIKPKGRTPIKSSIKGFVLDKHKSASLLKATPVTQRKAGCSSCATKSTIEL